MLIPHVVRAEMLDPLNLREVDAGTANDVELRHVSGVPIAQQENPVMVGAPTNAAAASLFRSNGCGRGCWSGCNDGAGGGSGSGKAGVDAGDEPAERWARPFR